ncbi:hypothetical protein Aph02nite_45270 [Actinoplanes philippinensis]|uniref:Uncharacterized protein n=1 Tax=Actinoplanes philippinensis TaxID=35752 RepID=A0A1I2I612_9ACTN|nr:hypothetical protein [Actinoplanes philippinensis]GIE78577.1 hypothetical protein Aph02nite_45270 [Actinoplanes philippinensis]SFF37765.1 hypothetical protein SAMN05421541_109353 [Actinoplanes philippinensis]
MRSTRTTSAPATGRGVRIPLPARIIIAVILTVAGEFLATACSLIASWQYDGGFFSDHPWQLWFALACAGVVACLAVPGIAWWLLLPRVRRLGPILLVAVQTAWILYLVHQHTTSPS